MVNHAYQDTTSIFDAKFKFKTNECLFVVLAMPKRFISRVASICLMVILALSVFIEAKTSSQNQPSPLNMDELAVIGIHPLNWIENDLETFLKDTARKLHIQFLDRATGFMEGPYWRHPYVNDYMVKLAKESGIPLGSYMILTPIPPPLHMSSAWPDPYGRLKEAVEVCGGRDLEGTLIYHSDRVHVTMSVSCPPWLDHFVSSAQKILEAGVYAIDVDNIANAPFAFGGDFSDWAVYRFREHLIEKYGQEAAQLGIGNLTGFDIREYVIPRLNVMGDILVIAAPTVNFSREEIEQIVEFVSNGGGLLVQAESMSASYLNALLQRFGLSVSNANILSQNPLWDSGSFEARRMNRSHPITKELDRLVLNWAVAIDTNRPDAIALVETDELTWLDLDMDLRRSPAEPTGPFKVVVALEQGKGRVVVIGDRSQDSMFWSFDPLIRKTLSWLAKGHAGSRLVVFDETKNEYATLSAERAMKLDPNHPEWVFFGEFKKLAEFMGFKVMETGRPPSFPEDAVLREFVKFQHMELVRFVRNFVERVKLYGKEVLGRDVPIYGNQFLGGGPIVQAVGDTSLDSIILSPYLDLIQVEGSWPTLPPINRYTLIYRIAHAMAEHKKPVWQHIAFYGSKWLDAGVDYTKARLIALEIAAAYANGVIKELDLAGWPGACLLKYESECRSPIKLAGGVVVLPNMTVPEEVRKIVDFIWENRGLLVGFKPYSKVALVYSIPSLLWNWFPALKVRPTLLLQEIVGVADILQNLHVPFDVVIFGHPELYDDSFHLKRMKAYDVVILPLVTHLSRYQVEAIRSYVKSGGRIVFTHGLPIYDEEHNPLSPELKQAIDSLLQAYPDRVIFLKEPVGNIWYENLVSGYAEYDRYRSYLKLVEDALARLGMRPLVRLEGIQGLVEVSVLSKGMTFAVHIVNYNYEISHDEFKEQNGLRLYVDLSAVGLPLDVTWLSPEGFAVSLSPSVEDRYLVFDLPRVNYWGLLVLNKPNTMTVTTTKTVKITTIETTKMTEMVTLTRVITETSIIKETRTLAVTKALEGTKADWVLVSLAVAVTAIAVTTLLIYIRGKRGR